jgi:hypothetical protein
VAAFQVLPRYEFRRDNLGRLVRLDAISGEIALVENVLPASMAGASDSAAETPPRARRTQPARGRLTTPPKPADTAPPAQRGAPTTLCALRGLPSTATTITDTPVLPSTASADSPLLTLAGGVQLPILDRSGEWLLIRLEGVPAHTVGYVHCSRVRDVV